MLILHSFTLQTPDGGLHARLRTSGSESLLVQVDGAMFYRDPSKVRVGDVVQIMIDGELHKTAVVAASRHEYGWKRQAHAPLVNMMGRAAGGEQVKWSTPVDTEVWRVESGQPVVRKAGDLTLGDYVWSPVVDAYICLNYVSQS